MQWREREWHNSVWEQGQRHHGYAFQLEIPVAMHGGTSRQKWTLSAQARPPASQRIPDCSLNEVHDAAMSACEHSLSTLATD